MSWALSKRSLWNKNVFCSYYYCTKYNRPTHENITDYCCVGVDGIVYIKYGYKLIPFSDKFTYDHFNSCLINVLLNFGGGEPMLV